MPTSLFHSGRALALLLCILLAACGSGGESSLTTCGNGRLDGGEQCDDGNLIDTDACTAVCRPARCGDGAIRAGVEACDGTNLGVEQPPSCQDLGYAAGEGTMHVGCAADCAALDVSICGDRFTPTPIRPTATATFTPTATPTPLATTCGDGLLEPGETCDSCPDDCVAAPCTPSGETATFALTINGARTPSQVNVQLAYRTTVLSLPGTGNDVSVRQRVRAAPPIPTSFTVNDLDYAVDIQSVRMLGLPSPFATARFDTCAGAAPPTVDDLACVVSTCADGSGAIPGCACTLARQP